MATGYKIPTAIVEFAPATSTGGTPFGPLRLPTSGDWVALTTTVAGVTKSRCHAFDSDRGRSDKLDTFDPGTATFVLDNTDGQLDEYKSGSLTEGNKGAPLTPIRFRLTNAYTGTTKTIWSGYITSGWEPSGPGSRVRTVTVRAVDWMGWAASRLMPESHFASWIGDNTPDVWWRGRLTKNRITSSGGYAWDSGSSGFFPGTPLDANRVEMTDALAPGEDSDPAMRWFTGARMTTGTSLPTTTTGSLFQFVCVFQITAVSAGRDLACGRTGSSTGTRRWRVRVGNTGIVAGELFDAAGASLGVVTIAGIPHNDGKPHFVKAEFRAAAGTSYIDLTTDLGSTGGGIGVAGTPGGPGGFIVTGAGTTDDRILVDEWAYTSTTYSIPYAYVADVMDDEVDLDVWSTDTITDRLARLGRIAKVTLPTMNPYFTPSAAAVGGFIPQGSLAAAIQATASSLAGAAWATRAGDVQVYGYGDLGNAWFTAAPITFSSNAATSGAIRFTGSGRTGRLLSRVINEVQANDAIVARDQTSVGLYGLQTYDLKSVELSNLATYAASIVTARKNPTSELGEVTVQPWGDQVATTWLIESCELGRQVSYVEMTPDGTATAYSDTLAVQSESWSWSDSTDWTVTLKLA